MKTFRTLAMLAFTSAFLVSGVLAQSPETAKTKVNYSPYYAKIGRTIFVSGPSSQWSGLLLNALPAVKNEAAMRAYNSDPSKQIDLVVFVNATSPHPEKTGGAWFLIDRLKGHSVSTKIVGECDMFCARLFIAGKTRDFGQDLNGEPARMKIQLPVDFETKSIERRFPNSQIALYESLLPDFSVKYRELLVRGFTQPVDITGGVFVGPDDVKYCSTLKAGGCENYVGLNAFKMGLTTSHERMPITLPERFPAPIPTGFAAIDDLSKVPLKDEKTITKYARFLNYPNRENRAFAISENNSEGVSVGAWGAVDGEEAAERVLRQCEEISKGRCRLYASGSDVVW
jgi:hypothetical protein